MSYQFTLNINDVEAGGFVAASGYKWTQNDIHDETSGRTMDAIMHVIRIGSKDQLDISCRPMTHADAVSLLAALTSSAEFSVTYSTPMQATARTATFYNPSRNCEFLMCCRNVLWWQHIKFTLTEC